MTMAGNTELLTQFGVISAMRTGNPTADMLLMGLVPLLLSHMASSNIRETFLKFLRAIFWFWRDSSYYTRSIQFTAGNYRGSMNRDVDERNNILQKALSLYIAYLQRTTSIMSGCAVADLSLLAVKERSTFDYDQWRMVHGGTSEQLKAYDISTIPASDQWIQVKPGIEFMRTTNREDEDKEKKDSSAFAMTTIFQFRSPKAAVKIDAFVQDAFDWYIQSMEEKSKDNARYMYVMVTPTHGPSKSSEETPTGHTFKRYRLSDEKKFASLFFPEKAELLRLFGLFMRKEGKFAIPGFPYKLGLLLHGPPGTGKTSLIKAMAQHMDRSIVSIPLGRIRTNQELFDIMYDQVFELCNSEEDMPVRLAFQKAIFVMEDVDTASTVVHKRSSGVSTPPCGAASAASAAGEARGAQAGAAGEEASAEPLKENEKVHAIEELMCTQGAKGGMAGGAGAGTSAAGGAGGRLGDLKKLLSFAGEDELDLGGVLNALDGVVDCPGRVVVMTTNHPEKLDPALIRPGRINKKIFLGRLQVEQGLEMAAHYFGGLGTLRARLEGVLRALGEMPTPAQLEQACADYDTLEELVGALEGGHRGGGDVRGDVGSGADVIKT